MCSAFIERAGTANVAIVPDCMRIVMALDVTRVTVAGPLKTFNVWPLSGIVCGVIIPGNVMGPRTPARLTFVSEFARVPIRVRTSAGIVCALVGIVAAMHVTVNNALARIDACFIRHSPLVGGSPEWRVLEGLFVVDIDGFFT